MTSEEEAESRTYHLKGGGIFHGGSEESGGAIYCEGRMELKGTKFILHRIGRQRQRDLHFG